MEEKVRLENNNKMDLNSLSPNDVYIRRTAQLTSRRCILNNLLNKYTY